MLVRTLLCLLLSIILNLFYTVETMKCDDCFTSVRTLYRFICIRVHLIFYVDIFGEYVLTVCFRPFARDDYNCVVWCTHQWMLWLLYCDLVDLFFYTFSDTETFIIVCHCASRRHWTYHDPVVTTISAQGTWTFVLSKSHGPKVKG